MSNFYKKLGIIFVLVLMFGITGNNVQAASIGQQLTTPEEGWQRIDDSNPYIKYGSEIVAQKWPTAYNNTIHQTQTAPADSKIEFKFVGTKFRILLVLNRKGISNISSKNVSVKVDGEIVGSFNATNSLDEYTSQVLAFEKLNLNYGIHTVILNNEDKLNCPFDAVDIDSTGCIVNPDTNLTTKIDLNKFTDNLNVGQTDTLTATITPESATNKNVKWTSSNPEIATVDETGKVTAIKEGTAIITATTQDGSNLSDSCTVNVTSQIPPVSQGIILNIEPEKNKIHLNESVIANLTIDNIKDIAAEDVRIKYDNTKLQFLGVDEVEGIKLVKQPDSQPGELRFIVASKGEKNVANSKKALLKLNFKGIKPGEALVDVVKGRVSDGIEMEKDLTDEQCGQATIIIDENALKDVNNSGEFTLLDLAIDARHMGKDPKSSELTKYNTDIVENNAIDDADLLEIGKYMLENQNYKF